MIIALGTNNKDKVIEIQDLLKGSDIEIVAVDESKGIFDPEETGETFEENAIIKAKEAARLMNMPALADDSGLVIDALGGEPGIHSARYADTSENRIKRVLNELKDVPDEKRTARFICSMVLVNPDGKVLHACKGICEGVITTEPIGEHGFGYDPIFYLPEFDKTMAELTLEEKNNNVSHRSKAIKCMIEWLKTSF